MTAGVVAEVLTDVPDRVLAVYAHPDDPEMSCGGALARWAEGGAEVRLVIVNAGDKGSPDPGTDPLELTKRRAAEVDAAAEVLGLAAVERFGLPDGEVANNADLRARLVALVRAHRPDLVVAPDPTAVFFGDSYVNHRDHREVGWAALDAVAPAAASPLYFPGGDAAHQVRIMLLSGSLVPDIGVDISSVIEKKIVAVQCHESRVGGDPALVGELIRARTAEAGAPLGVGHAEAFRRLRFG